MSPVELRQLESRFGRQTLSTWWNQAELVARMAFDSMVAISQAAGKPAAPESLAIVLRYQSDDPEGLCAVAAVSPGGPMPGDAKQAILKRALACLETGGDILVVQDKKAIVAPPTFDDVSGAKKKQDGEVPSDS